MAKLKVVCAMSGGVDSAVAAAILKKSGFQVLGVFMKFWKEPDAHGLGAGENRCCSSDAERSARLTAMALDIPFYALDVGKEFKEKVVDCFLEDSKKGLTPNPCVVCNKTVKFGLLLEKALGFGYDRVATGHYARLKEVRRKGGKIIRLLKGRDKSKDQSYFLWRLGQEQLKHLMFPLGGLAKAEVRVLAKKYNLPSAEARESQEICFVPGSVEDFLKEKIGRVPGDIVDVWGRILGRHEGLWFYTFGQRKGIKLPGGPYYVLRKDMEKNRLIVTKDLDDLKKREILLSDVNWIAGDPPAMPQKIKARIRYRAKEVSAEIRKDGGYALKFARPQLSATPGQSAVFYKGEETLGGGIIAG